MNISDEILFKKCKHYRHNPTKDYTEIIFLLDTIQEKIESQSSFNHWLAWSLVDVAAGCKKSLTPIHHLKMEAVNENTNLSIEQQDSIILQMLAAWDALMALIEGDLTYAPAASIGITVAFFNLQSRTSTNIIRKLLSIWTFSESLCVDAGEDTARLWRCLFYYYPSVETEWEGMMEGADIIKLWEQANPQLQTSENPGSAIEQFFIACARISKNHPDRIECFLEDLLVIFKNYHLKLKKNRRVQKCLGKICDCWGGLISNETISGEKKIALSEKIFSLVSESKTIDQLEQEISYFVSDSEDILRDLFKIIYLLTPYSFINESKFTYCLTRLIFISQILIKSGMERGVNFQSIRWYFDILELLYIESSLGKRLSLFGNSISIGHLRSILPKEVPYDDYRGYGGWNKEHDDSLRQLEPIEFRDIFPSYNYSFNRFISFVESLCIYVGHLNLKYLPIEKVSRLFRSTLYNQSLHRNLKNTLIKIISEYSCNGYINFLKAQSNQLSLSKLKKRENGDSLWHWPWIDIPKRIKFNNLKEATIHHNQKSIKSLKVTNTILTTWLCERTWQISGYQSNGMQGLSNNLTTLIRHYQSCNNQAYPQEWCWIEEMIKQLHSNDRNNLPHWIWQMESGGAIFESCKIEFSYWRRMAFELSQLIECIDHVAELENEETVFSLGNEINKLTLTLRQQYDVSLISKNIHDKYLRAVIEYDTYLLLNTAFTRWLNKWLASVFLCDEILEVWPKWCQKIDELLCDPILGVPNLNEPEIETSLNDFVMHQLNRLHHSPKPEVIFDTLMHQTEPLHAPFTDLLSNETTLGIWNQLEHALDAEFAKETTYYADPTRTVWPPFVIYTEFMEKILPPLPDISQVQNVLTEDQAMVLLCEIDGSLHSLCIYRDRSICIELEPHWNEMMEAWRSSYNGLSNIIDEMRNRDSSTLWKSASKWIEVFEKLLCNIESASTILLYAGTTSNLPWEWALKQMSHPECLNLQRIISVKHWLDNKAECQATDSYEINHRLLVQGCSPTSQDPDFTAMVNMWISSDIQDSQQPLHTITETLAALQLSPELHYFGHGFSNEQSPSANFLSMGENKLFARLLALCNPTTSVANISACHSAHSVNNIGIANLLLAGGVQSCIACLWEAEALSLLFFNSILSKAVQEKPLSREIFLSSIESLKAVTWKDIKAWLSQEAIQKDMPDYAKFWNTLSLIDEPDDNEKPFHHPYFFACYIWMGK